MQHTAPGHPGWGRMPRKETVKMTANKLAAAAKATTDAAVTVEIVKGLAVEICRNAGNPAKVASLALEIVEALDD